MVFLKSFTIAKHNSIGITTLLVPGRQFVIIYGKRNVESQTKIINFICLFYQIVIRVRLRAFIDCYDRLKTYKFQFYG